MLFNDPFAVPRDMDLGFTCDDLRDAVVDRVDIYLEGDVGAHRQLPSAPRRGGLEGDRARSAAAASPDGALSWLQPDGILASSIADAKPTRIDGAPSEPLWESERATLKSVGGKRSAKP